MTTLHAQAASKPLTYITPTPDTATPPEALYSLYDGYFQYFARKGFVEPANAEQVRPVLDLLPASHSRGNEYPARLPDGNTPVSLLTEITGLPPIATLAARYKYTQAVFANNPNPNSHPVVLTGDMLTPDEVMENLNLTEYRLEEYSDLTDDGYLLAVNTESGVRYPSKQFNPGVGSLIQNLPSIVTSGNNWVTLFTPHVALGYVSPIEYAKVTPEHRTALAHAYQQCQEYADDVAHMEAYMSGNIENSPYWDRDTGKLEDCYMENYGLA
jgi:hypothetical protein